MASFLKQYRFMLGTVLLSLLAGVFVGLREWTALALLVAAAIGVIGYVWPRMLLYASISTMVIGQVIRLPILGSELLLNDLIIPVLVVTWLLHRLAHRSLHVPRTILWTPLLLTVLAMIVSVFVNKHSYDPSEWMTGTLYLWRWIEYLALFFITYDLADTEPHRRRLWSWLVGSASVIAVLGFFQLYFFPDFTSMVPQGWDPHIGRLLSTWYDPNFLGGYLAIFAAIALAQALLRPSKHFGWWSIFLLLSLAEVLTFSRSGYVGFVIAIGCVAAIRSRALLFIGVLSLLATVALVPRVQERVIGIRTVDQTAQFRLVSWGNALDVLSSHSIFGVGYNHYKFVQEQRGFVKDLSEHSASGSDSSLLTIWVTTGTIGLLAYLWLAGALLWEHLRTFRDAKLSPFWRANGLALIAGVLALAAHGQFVNSWFYPHLMQVLWMTAAITLRARQP